MFWFPCENAEIVRVVSRVKANVFMVDLVGVVRWCTGSCFIIKQKKKEDIIFFTKCTFRVIIAHMFDYLKKIFQGKRKWFIGGGILVLLLIILIGKGNGDDGVARYSVTKGDVIENLLLTGEARPVRGADMAFSTSGTIDHIFKQAGDKVFQGEKIAELDNDSLRADLADAEAALELARAESKVSTASLDQEVVNAYRKLLNNDLQAYPKDGEDYSVSAPEVSGTFTGDVSGSYMLDIYSSISQSGASYRYSGFEQGTGTVNQYAASKLGTKGLYLTFDDSDIYTGTEWVIPIPNTRSATYTTVLNAYNTAVTNRDAVGSSNVSAEIAAAKVKQAEAGVARIVAQINERTIRAPFAGVVSKVDMKIGEIAEAGNVVTGVISDGVFEVVVQVPEIDIVNLTTNLPADITLDAYGEDVVFTGTVTSIDPAETEVDGVSVYRATVTFSESDSRIRSGMTASVAILKNKKENVLRAPLRFFDTDDTGMFALVENLETEKNDKVYITTGLRGSDGFVEILSGLNEGDVLIGSFE